jgi:hypothetical protein
MAIPRLLERYRTEVVPAMRKEFDYRNVMRVPRVEKVVLNIGLGEALQNAKALDAAAGDMATIAGQKPVITKAKRSIAAFKLRETFAACLLTPSMGAATTAWACGSSSSGPRSAMTRSTRCAACRSRSSRVR